MVINGKETARETETVWLGQTDVEMGTLMTTPDQVGHSSTGALPCAWIVPCPNHVNAISVQPTSFAAEPGRPRTHIVAPWLPASSCRDVGALGAGTREGPTYMVTPRARTTLPGASDADGCGEKGWSETERW